MGLVEVMVNDKVWGFGKVMVNKGVSYFEVMVNEGLLNYLYRVWIE